MKKAIASLVACALLALGIPGLAGDSGVYAGSVVATESVNVLAPCDGTLAEISLTEGGAVREGDVVAAYQTEKVYATGDGTVTALWAKAGEDPDDNAVLEIEPIDRYTIYATTDGAYSDEENLVVHSGESVYIKCTTDGTHRGTGEITQIDGTDYTVITTGGEFFVGETVYLYRDADFTSAQKIGIGTLIYSDNTKYDSDGTVIALHVQEGDRVERGQLLYEVLGTDDMQITAPASGIVASVFSGENGATDGATATDAAPSSGAATASSDAEQAGQTADAAAQMGGDTASGSAETADASAPASGGSETATEASASAGTEEAAAGDNAISEGDAVAVIYPYDAMMIQISVSEADLKSISVGESVCVLFADDDETSYAGTVEKISNVAEGGAYAALISVDRDVLYLGMTCEVFPE